MNIYHNKFINTYYNVHRDKCKPRLIMPSPFILQDDNKPHYFNILVRIGTQISSA